MVATVPAVRFGRYKGTPISEVPTQYLTWVMETFQRPPKYIVAEVERRGACQFGRESVACRAAVVEKTWRDAKGAKRRWRRKKPGAPKSEKRALRAAKTSEAARQKAKAAEARMAQGVWLVGSSFHRLREEFVASGGDVNSCPFVTPEDAEEDRRQSHMRSIAQGL